MSSESDFYRQHVPKKVNERLLRTAILAVSAAHDDSARWPGFERDAVPDLRRLNFNSGLMFATWGRGLSADQVEHRGGSHVEIRSKPFVLSSVTRGKMPGRVDPHEYRKTLAYEAQGDLFKPWPTGEPEFIFGLLVYGGHHRLRVPRFCCMTFPTPEGVIAPGTIDLLKEYAYIVEPFQDTEYRKRETARFIEQRESVQAA